MGFWHLSQSVGERKQKVIWDNNDLACFFLELEACVDWSLEERLLLVVCFQQDPDRTAFCARRQPDAHSLALLLPPYNPNNQTMLMLPTTTTTTANTQKDTSFAA